MIQRVMLAEYEKVVGASAHYQARTRRLTPVTGNDGVLVNFL
jgi:hypothetical protein